MQRHRIYLRSNKNERGIVIMLVAVFMLFVVGAMAALSIDAVTLYTARSEAQLAADSAALAAARAIANSGATSDTTGALLTTVEASGGPVETVARQVAKQNDIAGITLTDANITFNYGTSPTDPTVTVRVQVTTLPTFFSRIWGNTQLSVSASATAEAYNPSNATGISAGSRTAVAPVCVKPWLLPNIDPSGGGGTIFGAATGDITDSGLLGWSYNSTGVTPMTPACPGGDCSGGLLTPAAWNYYPGDDASFPHPTTALPACTPALTTNYQESVAGCVQKPIACNDTVSIDVNSYARNADTTGAVNCLTHATTTIGDADQVDPTLGFPPPPPFQFLAGNDNPVPGVAGKDVTVSSSLVTVPVVNLTATSATTTSVQIIGFVQLFLNPNGQATPAPAGNINATIINMAGCGTGALGSPVQGQGSSPVAVRLISAP